MPFLWTLRDGSFSSQARLLQSSAPDVLDSALTLQQTIQKKMAEDEQAKKAAGEDVPQEPQTSAVEAEEQDDDDYDDFLYAQAIAERGETMEDEEDESTPLGGSTSQGGNRPPKALNAKAKTAPAAPTPSQTQPEEIEVAPMDLDAMCGFPVRPGVVIPSKCVTVASLRLTSESCGLFCIAKKATCSRSSKMASRGCKAPGWFVSLGGHAGWTRWSRARLLLSSVLAPPPMTRSSSAQWTQACFL